MAVFSTTAWLVRLRQAVHVGARRPHAPKLAEVFDRIAEEVPPIVADRPLDTTLGRVADLLDVVVSEVEGV